MNELEQFLMQHFVVCRKSKSGVALTKHYPGCRRRVGGCAFASPTAGGYWYGMVLCKKLYAHRVVWFLTHGQWPDQVDHINGDRRDNRIENLRSVGAAINLHNRVCKGYNLHRPSGLYRAAIRAGGKYIALGYFSTEEAAHSAYLEAKRHLHPTAPERCYAAS